MIVQSKTKMKDSGNDNESATKSFTSCDMNLAWRDYPFNWKDGKQGQQVNFYPVRRQ